MHIRVLDFDFTLAHFTDGVESLCEIFSAYGVAADVAHQGWLEAEQLGFTIDVCRNAVERIIGKSLPKDDIAALFRQWLRANLSLYEDSQAVINRWNQNDMIWILTFGNREYQFQKISSVDILFHQVVVTTEPNTKFRFIQRLVQKSRYPIMFVDDKPSELDAVRDAGLGNSQIETVLIRRSDSPYFEVKPRYPHRVVWSLAELD
jgi:FMN phosphatase YigB (HAD superfamily)